MFAGHCVVDQLAADTGPLSYPANTGYSHNAISMLAHRLRRWPSIETALGETPVFAGILAINLLAAEGETSPVFVYKNVNPPVINILLFPCGDRPQKPNVCRHQILTSKVDPCNERDIYRGKHAAHGTSAIYSRE